MRENSLFMEIELDSLIKQEVDQMKECIFCRTVILNTDNDMCIDCQDLFGTTNEDDE